jgi:hypothetical protein
MRGADQKQSAMFSYITLAQRIPADHPARQIRVKGQKSAPKEKTRQGSGVFPQPV